MNNQLNELENKIRTLIEVHLVNFLPKQISQKKLAKILADALRASLSTQHLNYPEKTISLSFLLAVHPSKLDQLQKSPQLLDGLTKIIQQVSTELALIFSGVPSITLTSDPSLDMDSFDISLDRIDQMTKTQNMSTSEKETAIRPGFLIIGGANVYPINQSVTNIGRQSDNQIVLDDPRVSRYHAQIRYARNHFIIFDLNSTGGTFVNDQRATQRVLYPGDVINLAGLAIVFGQDPPPPSTSIDETAPLNLGSNELATITLNKPTFKKHNQK